MGAQSGPGNDLGLGSFYLTVRRPEFSFPRIEQVLVHLFSGAQADEFDHYLGRRFPTLANQRMRQIEYAYWIAHIEHQNVAVLTDRECLQNQSDSLRNRHEKPGDFR